VTLWPHEQLAIEVGHNNINDEGAGAKLQVSGLNAPAVEVQMDNGWVETENQSGRLASPSLALMSLLALGVAYGIR
jgi:hypothetical protein